MNSPWQPISSAPRDGTRVLLFWPSYAYSRGEAGEPWMSLGAWKTNLRIERLAEDRREGMVPSYFATNDEWDDYGLALPEHHPTHWVPLPAPPTEGPTS